MRTVEKVRGGRVYIRPLNQRFTIGDRATVDEELAAYLCEERGDFERVDDEPDDTEQDSMAALEAQLAGSAGDEETHTSTEEEEGSGQLPFSPETRTIDELEQELGDVDDEEALVALRNLEEEQKDRTGAKDAIDARLNEQEG